MNERVNGAGAGAIVQVQLVRTVILRNPGMRLVYALTDGRYVGQIEFEGVDQAFFAAIANDFQAFIAQQTGGLQVAQGLPSGLPKLS